MINLEEIFEVIDREDAEYLAFDKVEKKMSDRSDVHAFMFLDKLVPGIRCMISSAEHDKIYLGVRCRELAAVASEADILTLARCRVLYDSKCQALYMFV